MTEKNQWIVTASRDAMARDALVSSIAENLGIRLPTAQLLVNRGCDSPASAKAFLGKEEEQLHDPFLMRDMDRAAERIVRALNEKEKIVVFGDYDVDGVTSVTCLYLYLRDRGGDAGYFIPCRAGDGYGLSSGAAEKLAEAGYRLIVTVDTGVTAVAEAETVKSLGLSLVVTDHHECPGSLPDADAVVNPRRADCPYPFKELAGVGVVFKLLCALEFRLTGDPMIDCVRRISRTYGDLVAIGTVADVMPVRDENRLIVAYGLGLIDKAERPGLVELMEAARGDARPGPRRKTTASLIGYTIAPRINAAGRIRDASLAVELFLAPDRASAAPIARQLCDINRERQAEENKIIEEAYARIAGELKEDDPVLVLEDETWHHGVIGIVASRLTEKYNRPSILISFEGSGEGQDPEDLGKGSGRSVRGLNLADALGQCSDLLVKHGGHELAAGLTIKRKDLPAFREKINQIAREALSGAPGPAPLEADCELWPEDVTMEQAQELYMLEPYGVSNPVPQFVMRGLPLLDASPVAGGKHMRLLLRVGRDPVNAMFFRKTPAELDLYPGDTADVLFHLDVNEFQSQKNVQLIVRDIRLSAPACDIEEREREVFEELKAGKRPDGVHPSSLVPEREDFAAVYNAVRRENRFGRDAFTTRSLLRLVAGSGREIGYPKMRIILDVFAELGLLTIQETSPDTDAMTVRLTEEKEKRDLGTSRVLASVKELFDTGS